MFEESVESFVAAWRAHAAPVELFSGVEGTPLLECMAAGKVFHLFERTAPYSAPVGPARVIIHPVTEALEPLPSAQRSLEVLGISRLRARGQLVHWRPPFAVVDVGVPLVVGLFNALPAGMPLGEYVRFDSQAPVHGFVLPTERGASFPPAHADAL
jgi:hypothetical protein